MVEEVTQHEPSKVDYDQQVLRNITYFTKLGDVIEEKRFLKMHQEALPDLRDQHYLHEMADENGKIRFEVRMPLKVINPLKFTSTLTDFIKSDVEFIRKRVVSFDTVEGKIVSCRTSDGEIFELDKYVLSAGMGSVSIGKMLGIDVPLLPMKGLSINVYHKD